MDEDMKNSLKKHDIKTTFLIANSFHALIGGLIPLCVGAPVLVDVGMTPTALYALAFGTSMAGVAFLGYYAAFHENKKILILQAVLMGLVAAAETLIVTAATDHLALHYGERIAISFLMLHTGVTLAALSLASYLAKQLPSVETPNSTSWLGHCLAYIVYGVFGVIIVGYIIKFI